jgi:mono/diheme cytochrome c family protein
MKVTGAFVVFGVLVASGVVADAGVALAAEASEPSPFSAQEQQGKILYGRNCIYCHGPGLWATNRIARRLDKDHALLENRTDLSAEGVRAIVRSGVGSMPPLRKTELSDADVDAIAAYLTRKAR